MWEISEGGIEFLYVVKLVPPKDSRKCCSSRYYSLKLSFLTTIFTKKLTLFILTYWQTYICIYFILFLYKHPRACINFLKMYDEWACTRKFNITQYKFQPSFILRRDKIVTYLGICTTCTNWNNQCGSINRTGMDWRPHGHTSNQTFGRTRELQVWNYFYTYWLRCKLFMRYREYPFMNCLCKCFGNNMLLH